MFKLAKPVFLICETPLHAGSGSDLGVVDLPIQRERHTDFPKIEGSSLKGGIREAFEGSKPQDAEFQQAINLTFGPEDAGDENHAGALGFTDARLLLFPVKSMKGVFAWITCPKILQQFVNDLALCQMPLELPVPDAQSAPQTCNLLLTENQIVLEEYTFEIQKDGSGEGVCTQFAKWLSERLFPSAGENQLDPFAYWRTKIQSDIVVLPNDDFRDFVMLSTEVITRTKINNETGTVQPGALFTEEYLPAESILYSLVLTTPIFNQNKGMFAAENSDEKEEKKVMEFFKNELPEIIQLGGNATIGKGLIRTHLLEG